MCCSGYLEQSAGRYQVGLFYRIVSYEAEKVSIASILCLTRDSPAPPIHCFIITWFNYDIAEHYKINNNNNINIIIIIIYKEIEDWSKKPIKITKTARFIHASNIPHGKQKSARTNNREAWQDVMGVHEYFLALLTKKDSTVSFTTLYIFYRLYKMSDLNRLSSRLSSSKKANHSV